LILAAVYTYPLAFNLSSHVPGTPGLLDALSDSALQTWYPWWVRKALTSTESVLHSDWIFYPVGMEMTMQPAMFLHGLATVPLFWMDISTANNIVILASFALSGLSACLLGFYLFRSFPGAILCGFVFAFCPYKIHHIEGHYHLMATETIPLVALSLIRLYDRPTRRNLIWSGIWLGATVYTDYYYFAYSLLLVGLIAIYKLKTSDEPLQILRHTVTSGVLAFLVASPLLIPALSSAIQSDYGLAVGHSSHKADLLSPFVPSARQWIAGPVLPLIERFIDTESVHGIEHSIYAGWAILLLCLGSLRLWTRSSNARLFLIGAVIFFVMALGPELGINGHQAFGTSQWGVPLPSWLLMHLPFFEGARAPSRIVVVGMLCLAVCSGFAMTALLEKRRTFRVRTEIWAAAVFLFTGLEYTIPIGLSKIPDVEVLKEIATDREPGILAHVPLSYFKSALPQAYHGRKLLTVNLGRVDPDISQYYWRHEALQFLSLPHVTTRLPDRHEASYLIDLLGIRYIMFDRKAYESKRSEQVRTLLRNTYGLQEIHSDETSVVFRSPNPIKQSNELLLEMSDERADMNLAYGWSNREGFGSDTVAWMMKPSAILAVPPIAEGAYRLDLSLMVLTQQKRNLRIRIADHEPETLTIHPGMNALSIEIATQVLSDQGTNLITFEPEPFAGLPHTTGHNGRPSAETSLVVESGGYYTPDYGRSKVTVRKEEISNDKRGWFFVVIDPVSGDIETRLFRGLDPANTVENLRAYINELPERTPIAIARRTLGHIGGGTVGQAFEALGFASSFNPNPFNSFAAIVERNGKPPLYSTGAALATVAIGDQSPTTEVAIGLVSIKLTAR